MAVDYNLMTLAFMMVGTMGFLAFTIIYSLYYVLGRWKIRVIFVQQDNTIRIYKKNPNDDGEITIGKNVYYVKPENIKLKESGMFRGTRWVIIAEGNPAPLVWDKKGFKPDPAISPSLLFAVIHNKKVKEFNQSFGVDMIKVLLAISIFVNLIMGFFAFGGG